MKSRELEHLASFNYICTVQSYLQINQKQVRTMNIWTFNDSMIKLIIWLNIRLLLEIKWFLVIRNDDVETLIENNDIDFLSISKLCAVY